MVSGNMKTPKPASHDEEQTLSNQRQLALPQSPEQTRKVESIGSGDAHPLSPTLKSIYSNLGCVNLEENYPGNLNDRDGCELGVTVFPSKMNFNAHSSQTMYEVKTVKQVLDS
ncbi:hypothetical protein U1Q18_041662 [Sarracenia purpurea var. burkii]